MAIGINIIRMEPGGENMNLSIFLKSDQDKAKRELDCYGYLQKQAIELLAAGEFGMAARYHENIARSLDELQHMKNSKQAVDEAKSLLREVEERAVLMRRLRG